ncbi:uncharacterized protein LOC126569938 [Anopheles aquasalis]|uniref:uncharacterized protein LOC126569938 n=1 Tax=Anopheles aquasalis TaxID=42839 RepID=UPI00215A1684|nr:uncharacterized protein LOC126569938 [Anopheles aquasalis]
MKLQILFAFLVLVLSVSGKQWKLKNRKACRWSNRQIEILVPQGLRVLQPSSKSIAMAYGIEAYINRVPERSGICDICVNSTAAEPIFYPSAVIRAGDRFQYTLSYYYRSGSIRQYQCSFHVAEHRIKYDPSIKTTSTCSGAILSNSAEQQPVASDKVLLEELINDASHHCNGVSRMIVMTGPSKPMNRSQMEQFAASKLEAAYPGMDWTDEIQQVYRSENSLVIELKSMVAKRKLLRLIRDSEVVHNILDFDLDADEEASGDGFSEEQTYRIY